MTGESLPGPAAEAAAHSAVVVDLRHELIGERLPAEPEGIPAKRFMPDPARRPSNAVPNLAVGLTSLQDDLAPIAPEIAALADEADAAPAGRLRAAVRKLLGAFGKRER